MPLVLAQIHNVNRSGFQQVWSGVGSFETSTFQITALILSLRWSRSGKSALSYLERKRFWYLSEMVEFCPPLTSRAMYLDRELEGHCSDVKTDPTFLWKPHSILHPLLPSLSTSDESHSVYSMMHASNYQPGHATMRSVIDSEHDTFIPCSKKGWTITSVYSASKYLLRPFLALQREFRRGHGEHAEHSPPSLARPLQKEPFSGRHRRHFW